MIGIYSFLAFVVSYILNRTIFITKVNTAAFRKARQKQKPIIYAFWHGRPFYLIFSKRNEGITVITSKSLDGEIETRALKRYGYKTVRGSSSREGSAAARGLFKTLKREGECAIAVDGPIGPAGEVKPGIVFLAKKTGAVVIPVGAGFRKKITLKNWSRYIIPCPFTKGAVVYGDGFEIPEEMPDKEAAELIKNKIDEITQTADRLSAK
ncbi:MAG: lysophospholipid acyltransferase family protein [Elusimicrobia bacterium]|nr:lysophospholipid acyltransferase family protein [Elusimicrobiota bacterium]